MKPPFNLTAIILNYVSDISRLLGRYEGLRAPVPQPKLRRQNQIRTIQGSLAIEGNTLDLDQVTAIVENKRVLGTKREVLEVQNAIRLYDSLYEFNPSSIRDLLKAHNILMKGLDQNAGKFRSGAVGILKGSRVSHIAPPASRVKTLIEDLLQFLKADNDFSPLIKACVFHYELEFIHPFLDGNGRMGRFWQHLILTKYHPAFEYIPVESLIKERQKSYYQALEHSDKKGDSTEFLEFSLKTIKDALNEFLEQLKPEPETPVSRLHLAKNEFGNKEFSRKDYLRLFKTVSTATASRDLALGISKRLLERSGAKVTSRYRFSE